MRIFKIHKTAYISATLEVDNEIEIFSALKKGIEDGLRTNMPFAYKDEYHVRPFVDFDAGSRLDNVLNHKNAGQIRVAIPIEFAKYSLWVTKFVSNYLKTEGATISNIEADENAKIYNKVSYIYDIDISKILIQRSRTRMTFDNEQAFNQLLQLMNYAELKDDTVHFSLNNILGSLKTLRNVAEKWQNPVLPEQRGIWYYLSIYQRNGIEPSAIIDIMEKLEGLGKLTKKDCLLAVKRV